MTPTADPLTLFDSTRAHLHAAVADRLPDGVDLATFCDETAYWVCLAVTIRGATWDGAVRDYTEAAALERAGLEAESQRRELDLLRAELAHARGPVLDVGAGWGRLGPLYAQAGLPACYVEPTALGSRLMRRAGLRSVVAAQGEALPLPGGQFHTLMIGWVLHHDAGEVDARRLLREAARVTAPGGLLLSVEPLDERFDRAKWTTLISQAGFGVRDVRVFYDYPRAAGDTSHHALLVGTRLHG